MIARVYELILYLMVTIFMTWRYQGPGMSAVSRLLAIIYNWCWFNSSGAVGGGILLLPLTWSVSSYSLQTVFEK
jgi:hypothetical protein